MQRGQSSSTQKTERKVLEKNRRNHMKILYSNLCSLLPDPTSKEALPLYDQVDEAVKYIKSLQIKMERNKEKKEKLVGMKRSRTCFTTEIASSSKSPEIEIHEMGALDLILVNGLDNQSLFYKIIRLLHQEGAEVVHANYSSSGNSVFQVTHDNKTGEGRLAIGPTTISRRLKEIVSGSSDGDQAESGLELWDFVIQPDIWEIDIPEIIPMGILG